MQAVALPSWFVLKYTLNKEMKDNLTKVIYVIGAAHSGSTLLDILLSHYPDAIGLGEVFSILKGRGSNEQGEATSDLCSCGKNIGDCEFWSEYYRLVREKGIEGEAFIEKYKCVLLAAEQGNKSVIIDSSKKRGSLRELQQMEQQGLIDLRVLFLVRDVRGWVCSFRNRMEKKGTKISYYTLMSRWYRKNKAVRKFLTKSGVKYKTVSYESLCLDTSGVLDAMAEFLGLDRGKLNLENEPASHIAFGNRMKKEMSGRLEIKYSHSWYYDHMVNFILSLMPHIFRLNKVLVYKSV